MVAVAHHRVSRVRSVEMRRAQLFSTFLRTSGYGAMIEATFDPSKRHRIRVLAYSDFVANFLDEELRPAS